MHALQNIAIKIIKIIFLLIHVIIFIGLIINNSFTVFGDAYVTDRIFSLGFIIIGVVFSIIVLKMIWQTITAQNPRLYNLNKNKIVLIITVVIFLAMYLGRNQITSLFLLAGAVVGDFIINQAQIGFKRVSPVDLGALYFRNLAWLGQFYLIHVIVGSIVKFIQKRRKLDNS